MSVPRTSRILRLLSRECPSDDERLVRFWPTNIVQNPSFPYPSSPFSLVFNLVAARHWFEPTHGSSPARPPAHRSPPFLLFGPAPLYNGPASPQVPRKAFFRKNPFYFGIFVTRAYLCRPKNVE